MKNDDNGKRPKKKKLKDDLLKYLNRRAKELDQEEEEFRNKVLKPKSSIISY